jgi:hypothetical protein
LLSSVSRWAPVAWQYRLFGYDAVRESHLRECRYRELGLNGHVTPPITIHLPGECRLWVNNGCAGRSSGTSAVPQRADDIGAPRKLAEVGQQRTSPPFAQASK